MTQALIDELKALEVQAILVQDVVAPEAVTIAAPATDPKAAQRLAEGRKALQKLQLPKAIPALEAAVAGFAGDDARAGEAALLLAEAHYRRGDEAKGRKALETVARVAPDTRLSPSKYPPVFISAFKEVRARVVKDSRSVTTSADQPGRAIRSGIEANTCDGAMRARGVRLARAPDADLVVLLGIANGERFFTVGGFAGDVRTGRWATLPTLKVDANMLSASIEGGKLARELVTLGKRFVATQVEGELRFVDAVIPPTPAAAVGQEPEVLNPDRRPLNDSTSFATFAPPAVQEPGPLTRSSATDNLERDTALAADIAALDGYATEPSYADVPLATSATEARRGGVLGKWWFWTAVGVGAAVLGGTAYYLMSRDRPSDTLSVQAAW